MRDSSHAPKPEPVPRSERTKRLKVLLHRFLRGLRQADASSYDDSIAEGGRVDAASSRDDSIAEGGRVDAASSRDDSIIKSGRVGAASTLLCLGLSALLVSDKLVEIADRLPLGADRDRWLSAAEATDRVSNLLSMNRPYDLIRDARGVGDDAATRIDSIGDLEDVLGLDTTTGVPRAPQDSLDSPDGSASGSGLDNQRGNAPDNAGESTDSRIANDDTEDNADADGASPSASSTDTTRDGDDVSNDANTDDGNAASADQQGQQSQQDEPDRTDSSDISDAGIDEPVSELPPDPEPEGPYVRAYPVSSIVPLRTYIAGDSQAFHLGHALQASRLSDILEITLDQRHSTGLARPSYFNWPVHVYFVAVGADPEIMIMTLGSNDWQNMTTENGDLLTRGSDEWRAEWARRLGVTMDVLRARHRRFIWVGLPPARSSKTHTGFTTMNELAAEVVAERSDFASMVDVWDLFGGDEPYRDSLPPPDDPEGRPVRVRQADGIHLNRLGAEWTAELVQAEIERIIAEISPEAVTQP